MPTTRSRPSSEPNDRHDRELKRTRAALQDDSIDSLTLRATCHLPPYSYFTEAVAPNPSIAESLSDSHPLTPRPLVGHSPGTPQLQAASLSHFTLEGHDDTDKVAATSRLAQPVVPEPVLTNVALDALLIYAYRLYESPQNPALLGMTHIPIFTPRLPQRSTENVYRSQLLPLLRRLISLHPRHLPTLLLLGCVHHATGDYDTSIALNQEILALDPNYVEAMCNMGMSLKAQERLQEAQEWFWRALQRRPTYWDALDNVINLLIWTPYTSEGDAAAHKANRKQEGLRICSHVLGCVMDRDARLLISIPRNELPRLQRAWHISATLRHPASSDVLYDYMRAVEVAIRPPIPYGAEDCYNFRDLILATYIASLLVSSRQDLLPDNVKNALHIAQPADSERRRSNKNLNLLRFAHATPTLSDQFLAANGVMFPLVLLSPDQATLLSSAIFSAFEGLLPALLMRTESSSAPVPERIISAMNYSTAATLLHVAKRVQDLPAGTNIPFPGFAEGLTVGPSLLLLFYSLSLSLSPSAAIYNNLGLVLAGIAPAITHEGGGHYHMSEELELAQRYFEKGLTIESDHPHLLTNLGSILKDQGRVTDAIRLYMSACDVKPDFDIALANLANALTDIGRPSEAALYFRRALEVSPDFDEAKCGLAGSLSAICDFRGRGGSSVGSIIDDAGHLVATPSRSHTDSRPFLRGWHTDMVDVCDRQTLVPYSHNIGLISAFRQCDEWIEYAEFATGETFEKNRRQRWIRTFERFYTDFDRLEERVNEGGLLIRALEFFERSLQRKWFLTRYGRLNNSSAKFGLTVGNSDVDNFKRPCPPSFMATPSIPTVLPFHTFICGELSTRTTRIISHRNGLRLAHAALTAPWRPSSVYPPPPPPKGGVLNVGYVSSDLNNHPLSHLMQSVFGLHNPTRCNVLVYATGNQSDGSSSRTKIETESANFVDMSTWTTSAIIERILQDQIHILVNLGGYTKDARNEIFAARPCPIQISMMGFAGTLGGGFCDYLLADTVVCPPDMCACEQWRVSDKDIQTLDSSSRIDFDASLDPESMSEDWIYTEKLIYMPHTYLATSYMSTHDHSRSSTFQEERDFEEARRREMRQDIFPDLNADVVIFANFNQLYKICPSSFSLWIRIMKQVPNAILWLLRFPPAGEEHLRRSARIWGGSDVEERLRFTDVVTKDEHLRRCAVPDLFLDTVCCSAHTVGADVLWAGTPLVTWPQFRHKMCSAVGASLARATGFGEHMIVPDKEAYERRAIALAHSLQHDDTTEESPATHPGTLLGLRALRRKLVENRMRMPLFDTARWTRNLETGYVEAWRRWVAGTEFEGSDAWRALPPDADERRSGCIYIRDDEEYERVGEHSNT